MRILFVTSNRIGDAVLSTGLLDHLLRTCPEARFTVACGPVAEGVFIRMPRLERLIVMEKRPWGRHWLPLWAHAASRVWDLVVDIRGSGLSWMVPTRRRAVMRRSPGHKIAQLGAILGLDPPPLPVTWTAPEDRARAAALLPPGPLVALGPTANWTGKVWPADRFVALHRALSADGPLRGARPVILAGPGEQERALAAPVLAALPDAVDLCGRLSLPEAAAVLTGSGLFVGNDSGLMHLAAAAGTPTLGLFGPTPAEEYSPAGRHTAIARAQGPAMQDLSVAAALTAAQSLIATAVPA
ncbi:ADP-heptose--lipooligosaccharide heptosyltransferase II [Rhodovastum atsumiense]|uniref:Glycosyltransferase family 9 protein n=1 Tax=Rhodovastum atsumiense TaxID=504468 RepID=A0A5M6J4Y9_9PROT|nr:glycosyltransferase family 9 protein [Rhodovastum atsumiense]KAA5614695.1 glycosyltransferase family 9 protein [Rhodovastum atsumiense]CAH2599771.1 ADP-heptose--lipooligosaccharide heptosyltransferase II [Rhodovastum atsumiense]